MATAGPALLFSPFVQDPHREQTIREQCEIEKDLIESKNGVFILFTLTHGTPLMISEDGIIPEGLIPESRIASYESSVKPRVETTHAMPAANVNCLYIRHKAHRPHADKPDETVNEAYYFDFLNKHPGKILDKVIPEDQFKDLEGQGMPAAFYYYIPVGCDKPQFWSVFADQINRNNRHSSSNSGTFLNREQDLKIVNLALETLGFPPVDQVLNTNDIRTLDERTFAKVLNP